MSVQHAAALLLALLVGSTSAQRISTVKDKCALKIDRSPTIRGFKLGMTRAQAEKTFGASINYVADPSDGTGAAKVAGYQYPEKLPDVTSIELNFFKERVYFIRIVYAGGDFRSGQAAATYFSKAWNLPAASWESYKTSYLNGKKPPVGEPAYTESPEIRVLYCNGWGMETRIMGVGNPAVTVGQFGTAQLIAQEAARIRGAGFKP